MSEHETTNSIFERIKDSSQAAYTVGKRVAKEPVWGVLIFIGLIALFGLGVYRAIGWFALHINRITR